jgi:hypothetical protein
LSFLKKPRRRFARTAALRLAALLACLAALAAAAGTASAAPASDVAAVSIASGSFDLGGYDISGPEPVTLSVFNLHVTAHGSWSGSLTNVIGWDTGKVRQGAQLEVSRVSPLTSGHIGVSWTVTGTVSPLGLADVNIGTINLSKDNVDCAPKLSGGGYGCTATSEGVSIVKTPGILLSPYIDLVLHVAFDITPEGAVTTRDFSIGGNPVSGPDDLSLTDSAQSETLTVPCTAPVGDSVAYTLDPYHWTPATSATQQPAFQIGVMDPVFGAFKLPAIFDASFGSPVQTNPAFDLTGAGHATDLGALLPNNVPPTIAPFGSFSGSEGSAVQLSASTTSQCPISSYVWKFSDGTTSYGPTPKRTFTDNSAYNGELTVTDETGLAATRSFTVDVVNVPPSVNAGPDTTSDWGRPVAFNGQATDPGSADQSTLQYAWDFGDGSPSASGGPNVGHAYAAPGTYFATLMVCDKDEVWPNCPTDTRTVNVTKRDTTTAHTGDTSGTFDTPASLSASLVDEYGQPINGRPVTFQIGTDGPFTALTSSSGIATKAYTPALAAGSYAASSTFAGDALYNTSASSNAFTVTQKATSLAYTGATSGAPNKSVVLSAVLKDATGKPLAGRTIVFQLGSQLASAPTDASGVASAPLKLSQKNGTYSVSATFTPSSNDVSTYVGSSQTASFKLQAK